jgi:N-acetylmuramoyl-L-alanine amidase
VFVSAAITRYLLCLALAIGVAGAFSARAAEGPGEIAPSSAVRITPADPVIASGSRLAGDDKRTRFVVDVDRNVAFGVFTLADPYRIVIDLPETEFRFAPGEGNSGRGLVSAYRYGLIGPGKSRIVLDATGPVKVDKAFVVDAVDEQPVRLVVDLLSTSRQDFLAALALQPSRRAQVREEPAISGHEAVRPGAGGEGKDIVVVIDPGHGGIDPGAKSRNGTLEKDVVLDFAKRLRGALEKSGRFTVMMTRDDDVFVPLGERVKFARENRASLLISVHADSIQAGSVGGATVYTLSETASDTVAEALAEQENRSDVIAGVDLTGESDAVADILIDLVQRETKNYAAFFARTLVGELKRNTSLVKNPHRSAGFRVLKAHDVPSVLLELGYLTNPDDEKHLTDGDWQETIAASVSTAVSEYFGERHARAPF